MHIAVQQTDTSFSKYGVDNPFRPACIYFLYFLAFVTRGGDRRAQSVAVTYATANMAGELRFLHGVQFSV